QTILLHINDADECANLYGGAVLPDGTCFVYPKSISNPPPPLCNGNPACKQVEIDEADEATPTTVPGNTLLHIHYLYIIVNQGLTLADGVTPAPPGTNMI